MSPFSKLNLNSWSDWGNFATVWAAILSIGSLIASIYSIAELRKIAKSESRASVWGNRQLLVEKYKVDFDIKTHALLKKMEEQSFIDSAELDLYYYEILQDIRIMAIVFPKIKEKISYETITETIRTSMFSDLNQWHNPSVRINPKPIIDDIAAIRMRNSLLTADLKELLYADANKNK